MSVRPIFILHLRPEPDVDGVLALRRFLKLALRHFGLRCVLVTKQDRTPAQTEEPSA